MSMVVHFRAPHSSGVLCKARPGGFFVSDQDAGTPKVTCPRCLELLTEFWAQFCDRLEAARKEKP